MRTFCPRLIALILVAHFAAPAAASSIYRCVGGNAVVKFQDAPCESGETSRRINLPDAPPQVAVGDSSHTDLEQSTAPPHSNGQRESEPVIQPGAAAILCTREDGSHYLSDSGRGNRHAVPLGMQGYPGNSLAGAYGGSNGIGVSAPGLRQPPSSPSYSGRLGAMYVWVEDPCEQINAAQLCGFLRARIADTESRLRYAFSDTSKQVSQELESLRQRARLCPR